MKVSFFSSKPHDVRYFETANGNRGHELMFHNGRLDEASAIIANGSVAVCAFVNDVLSRPVLEILKLNGVKYVAMRCAGFNNVDLKSAAEIGIPVVRVPAYSPHAVAEHTIALILCLNRKLHRAYNRVREGNFALEGLEGFDLHGKTIGVIGTGKIGTIFAGIMKGFGCEILAYDPYPNPQLEKDGIKFCDLDILLNSSDIVSLHCPLTPDTYHIIDDKRIGVMKDGVMLVNTSRGALVDAGAIIKHLKSGHMGSVCLDVYEEEADLFFEDLSGKVIHDDVFARLMTFPNVLITSHQAFYTSEALRQIAETTLLNLEELNETGSSKNEIKLPVN